MELDKDFREFVELLNSKKVEYLVVGGYSVTFHGFPRYTGDFDIWINPTKENTKQLMLVLIDFGFGDMGLTYKDFLLPGKIVQFGVEPLRIDILTAIDGIGSFKEAYKRKKTTNVDNVTIYYIGFNDLIKNKKATNRLQDQRDVEELKKIESKQSKE